MLPKTIGGRDTDTAGGNRKERMPITQLVPDEGKQFGVFTSPIGAKGRFPFPGPWYGQTGSGIAGPINEEICGVPGHIGNPPGQIVQDQKDAAVEQGFTNLHGFLRDGTDFPSPGGIVSDVARGDLTPEQLEELLADLNEPADDEPEE